MTNRFKTYLKKPGKKEGLQKINIDTAENYDDKIDLDLIGFPHAQSKENIINPDTNIERKTTGIESTDGEKSNDTADANIDESASDGSGSAFDLTESVRE